MSMTTTSQLLGLLCMLLLGATLLARPRMTIALLLLSLAIAAGSASVTLSVQLVMS